MLHVTGIDLNPDSREEHLPGYTPNFPHIASLVQGTRYFGGKASWHWHESVELFYVRKGAILYRTRIASTSCGRAAAAWSTATCCTPPKF